MAGYRAPRHPQVEDHARRQTRIARLVGLGLMWILVALMALVAERTIPRQHLPWKPLSVVDPVGAATKAKAARAGDDLAACQAILSNGGLAFRRAEESAEGFCSVRDALEFTGGMAPLSPAEAPMTCKQALAVAIWERQVVQPAAFEAFGHAVVAVEHYGSFSCRRIYGQQAGPVSEHASANALDVSAFRLADGRTVSVKDDWDDPGAKGRFLRAVRDGACRVFLTTLSPDYNEAHADHFHLDMGGRPLCA
ncbi:extensin-like domain-containing protein [Phenylobacterium sp.]|uniref:extensin-like domain-containing protein n=1 Tax=Phenylobacterium sp. TaxID=1871053 RepID=UPI002FDB16BD